MENGELKTKGLDSRLINIKQTLRGQRTIKTVAVNYKTIVIDVMRVYSSHEATAFNLELKHR
jgi:hypothetical protein